MMRAHRGFKPLAMGFILALAILGATYFVGRNSVPLLLALGGLQIGVQLIFFLRVGFEEEKPRWDVIFFLFTLLVVAIVVAGSLWVMYNLDYQMMPGMKG